MSMLLALLAAVETAAVPPICTDRPAKANAICTVPPGKVQLESSLAGWSLTEASGTRAQLLSLGSTVLKLGVSGRSDLQVGLTPYARLTVRDGGSRSRVSGFGDVVVRYKQRLTSDHSEVQVAAVPFVKLPTARRGLGNDKVEGGMAVPVSFALSGPVTMTLGPEVDLLADGEGRGRHIALVNLVNVAAPVAPRLMLAAELWSNVNFDPAGTVKQASADAALAYAVREDLQLDAGSNLGLTNDTPDLEVYIGTSVRF
jgi:hypothetical protein